MQKHKNIPQAETVQLYHKLKGIKPFSLQHAQWSLEFRVLEEKRETLCHYELTADPLNSLAKGRSSMQPFCNV